TASGARRARTGDDVEESARKPRGLLHARRGRRRRNEEDGIETGGPQGRLEAARLFGRQVRDEDRVEAGRAGVARRSGEAGPQERVQVGKEHEAETGFRADPPGHLEDSPERRSRGEGALGRTLQDGAVRDRVRKRDAELENVRAGP